MIVVVCPAGAVTGGPEALHQLAHSLTRQGFDAAMLYLPGEYHKTPAEYQGYRFRTVSEADIYPTDVVVIPEVMAGEARRFAYARPVLWWLSVDNAPSDALTACGDHIAQSFYAWDHLRRNGFDPMMVSDYTPAFFQCYDYPREAWVAFNPVKGAELAQRFATLCPDIVMKPIIGMSRIITCDFLNRASAFIDFGHQPGKDRLPREAAASGAVVFIHDVGAARFRGDFPLPDSSFFTADDESLLALGERVREVVWYPDPQFRAQVLYHRGVARERTIFDEQVAAFARRFP